MLESQPFVVSTDKHNTEHSFVLKMMKTTMMMMMMMMITPILSSTPYRYYSYSEIVQKFRDLNSRFPNVTTVYTAQERFGVYAYVGFFFLLENHSELNRLIE